MGRQQLFFTTKPSHKLLKNGRFSEKLRAENKLYLLNYARSDFSYVILCCLSYSIDPNHISIIYISVIVRTQHSSNENVARQLSPAKIRARVIWPSLFDRLLTKSGVIYDKTFLTNFVAFDPRNLVI